MKKHIIITGASRGIGYQTSQYLAEKGCMVTAISRSQEPLASLRSRSPKNIFTLAMDITRPDAADTIKKHLEDHALHIDGLLHNAGILVNKPFTELSIEDWRMHLNINLMAPVIIIKELIGKFADNAHILNIGSMGGFQGSSKFAGLAAYSVSKGALAILSECLAAELSDQGIFCNCMCLGAVQTEMFQQAFPGFSAPVQPDEMGEFIGDFILKGHRFFNGQILPVTLGNPA